MSNPKAAGTDTQVSKAVVVTVACIVLLAALAVRLFQNRSAGPAGNGIDFISPNLVIPAVSGIIESVEANSLTIQIPQIGGVPIAPHEPLARRVVRITPETKFSALVRKADADYARELREFREEGGRGFPPHPKQTIVIAAGDLKVGDLIEVRGSGSDIKRQPTITALAIIRET